MANRETASTENHDTFLPLLDLLTSPNVFPQPLTSLTSKAIHDVSVRALLDNGHLSDPGALESFELSLSLHAASPKIEALYEFYRDHKLAEVPLINGEAVDACTGSWVEWYGHRVCSVDTLRALIEGTSELANSSLAVVCVSLLNSTALHNLFCSL
jgi:UDP-glucose:glycoprotein glucosyltransferase